MNGVMPNCKPAKPVSHAGLSMPEERLPARKRRFAGGMSLIEVMIAVALALTGVVGASGYRYFAAVNAREAAGRRTAARLALTVCEGWRGSDGIAAYDPTAYLSPQLVLQDAFPHDISYGSKKLGFYKTILNDTIYYVTCWWSEPYPGLMALYVRVRWPLGKKGFFEYSETNRSFSLTTYKLVQ
jgi:hypothetical protein